MKRIGIMTSGGDSPGMNAAVRAIVRTAIHHQLVPFGILRGYQGMIEGDIFELKTTDVLNIIQRGGTILKTARSKEFMTEAGMQKAFELYLGATGVLTSVYGALALLPIFLIWLHLSWAVVLIGGLIAATVARRVRR